MDALPPGNKKHKTNPHKVNQHTQPDPRQALFLALYMDPKSATFGNSFKSALTAGYNKTYAKHLKVQMPAWFSQKLQDDRHVEMLALAEKNFFEILTMDTVVELAPAGGDQGELFEPVKRIDPQLLRIKKDTSEFIAETIGKSVYTKQVKAGGGGANINFFTQINGDRQEFADDKPPE